MAASASDLIAIDQLRDATGVVGNAEDTTLEALRDAAVSHLEDYTHRKLIDGTVISRPVDFGYKSRTGELTFRMSDVKTTSNLVIAYAAQDADPTGTGDQSETILANDPRIILTTHYARIYPASDTYWTEIMRLKDPVPRLTATCGLAVADVPAEFNIAIRLIVRSLYLGTAYDQLPTDNQLSMLLHRHHAIRHRNPPNI